MNEFYHDVPEDTRDDAERLEDWAIAIARKHAKAKPQSYYSEPFQPHEWVVDAIIEALTSHLPSVQREMDERLERINMLACYASEEDTAAQPAALLEIGKLARKELAP